MRKFFVQDPAESREYQISWAWVLPDGVTIVESIWDGNDELTISNQALEGEFTAAFVSVNQSTDILGKRVVLTNTVTLSNNEVYVDSIFIYFEEK